MITPYKEIRATIPSFAIVNCIHKSWFYGLIGHTAMTYLCRSTGQLMIFESTQMGKSGVSGVQLNPMDKWVASYPGKVYIRLPEFPVSVGMNYRLEQFIQDHLGSSYPDLKTWGGRLKLAFSALDLNIFGKDIFTYKGKDDGIFCTMLVAMALQECGIMDPDLIASEFEPDDMRDKLFNASGSVKPYGDEIRIK